MIKNYLKIALRNIYKNKIFSLINIFGLAIGISSCILILLFVKDEWSFDRFHKSADEIYRVALFENYAKDQQFFNSVTPIPLGPALKESFPEVTEYVRIMDRNVVISANEKSFPERIHAADPALFQMFDFPIILGDKAAPLKEINSVIITRSLAEKYFNSENPLGKILSIKIREDYEDFVVTGITENVPSNSSIQFNAVIPFEKSKELINSRSAASWTNVFCETYILTKKGVSASELEYKVPALVKKIAGENYKAGEYNLKFQPITDIHLDTGYPVGLEPVSNPVYSYILSIIAVLVLIIASINFITLSIGRSASRAAEVGIRKVIGAERGHLIRQFWGESILIVFIAACSAVVFAEILLPYFNNFAGKTLSLNYDYFLICSITGIIIFVGMIAGIYPALILSSFKPVDVLKGKIKIRSRSRLRQILVAGQFTLSVILISCTMIISDQLEYIRNKNLGFKKEEVLLIPSHLGIRESFKFVELLRNELKNNSSIMDVTFASNKFNESWNGIGFQVPEGAYYDFQFNIVDYDFLKALGISLSNGRDFSREFPSDADEAVIVNESFAKFFKLSDLEPGRMPGNFNRNRIIGVIKDFNFESLHTDIKPAALVINPDNIINSANDVSINTDPSFYIRLKPRDFPSSLSFIRKSWEKIVPQIPFKFSFLDEELNKKYQSETRLSSIITACSVFAIFITCLGLLGLTMLITIRRRKEIGIRKVLGATPGSILKLLSKEFALLIIIANITGWPLAFYAMNRWLQDFSYRTDISAWNFLYSGIILLGIAMITIGVLVIKAANENPVKSLKYE